MIEIELENRQFPLAHIIRAANVRSLDQIQTEIRRVQADPSVSQSLENMWFLRLFFLLPAFLRDLFYGILIRSPHLVKRHTGTVMVTAVGMFGEGGGWGIGLPNHYTLGLLLGGIAEKPTIVDGQIVVREVLSMTLSFDHDIIDGAPAARFVARLQKLIEEGYGLDAR